MLGVRASRELLEKYVMKRVRNPLVYGDVLDHLVNEVPGRLMTEELFQKPETQKLLERKVRDFELTKYLNKYVESKGVREGKLIEAARKEIEKMVPAYMRIGRNLYSVKTQQALNDAIKRVKSKGSA